MKELDEILHNRCDDMRLIAIKTSDSGKADYLFLIVTTGLHLTSCSLMLSHSGFMSFQKVF